MSISSVLNILYAYPVPKLADPSEVIPQDSIKEVYDKYYEYFKGSNGVYVKIKEELLAQLNKILDKNTDPKLTIDDLDTNKFYTDAQKFDNDKHIDTNHCREGFMAYKFYLKEIATKIKTIDDYIREGQKALEKLAALSGSSEEINNQAHKLITDLEIYDKFIYEELEEFLTYYKYNEDTKQWDIIHLSVFDENYNNNYAYSQLASSYNTPPTVYKWNGKEWTAWDNPGKKTEEALWEEVCDAAKAGELTSPALYSNIQNLRDLEVKTIKANSDGSEGEGSMKLTSFNSLTLFDRLRYIRWYYKLMFSQQEKICGSSGEILCSDRFPNNNDTGYPCMPDVPSVSATVATQSLGALELFYVGYLINRDGPVNALSSFFEVKVDALRNNVALSSKKIEALNLYLDFINAGLDQLNKNSGHRPSDGSIIALTYLCGQKMYNLFEDDNGDKWFVVPRITGSDYFLIKADDSGKKFLLGDSTYFVNKEHKGPEDTCKGNGMCYNGGPNKEKPNEGLWYAYYNQDANDKELPANRYWYDNGDKQSKGLPDDFTPPTQIECMTIAPTSVRNYDVATDNDKCILETKSDNNVLGSWTDAFSRKTQFINTAIDTINTDVTLDRSKIDTFDSLTSTFRSRAQDTYQNILSNVR